MKQKPVRYSLNTYSIIQSVMVTTDTSSIMIHWH